MEIEQRSKSDLVECSGRSAFAGLSRRTASSLEMKIQIPQKDGTLGTSKAHRANQTFTSAKSINPASQIFLLQTGPSRILRGCSNVVVTGGFRAKHTR
jgi:hypothetical protein